MSESDLNTEETSGEVTKALKIQIKEDGSMGLEFDGDFNLYEIMGMLTVSIVDMSVKHFIVPYLNEQSNKLSEHILTNIKSDAIPDLGKGMEDINELNDSVKKIMGLVDAFKGMQDIGPATAP